MTRSKAVSVERERKDIREHDWMEDDFDVTFTDSTNPFTAITSQFNDPDYEYAFVLNDEGRIMDQRFKGGYEFVDPSAITGYSDIFTNRNHPDRITTRDLVCMKRPKRYREKQNNMMRKISYQKIQSCLPNIQQRQQDERIRNLESPFSE